MISGQALVIAVCFAMILFIGEEVAVGISKLHKEEKKVVAKIGRLFHHKKDNTE